MKLNQTNFPDLPEQLKGPFAKIRLGMVNYGQKQRLYIDDLVFDIDWGEQLKERERLLDTGMASGMRDTTEIVLTQIPKYEVTDTNDSGKAYQRKLEAMNSPTKIRYVGNFQWTGWLEPKLSLKDITVRD
jgi:hypothetical protein